MCYYEVILHPFCGVDGLEVSPASAQALCDPEIPVCCRYRLYPCERAPLYGESCVISNASYSEIMKYSSTIISGSLDDCNLPKGSPQGCRSGTGRRRTDSFGLPATRQDGSLDLVVKRRVLPGFEDEMEEFMIELGLGLKT